MKKVFLIVPLMLFSGIVMCMETGHAWVFMSRGHDDIEAALMKEARNHEFGADEELLNIWNKKLGADQDGLWYTTEEGEKERVTPVNVRAVTPDPLTCCALLNAKEVHGKGFRSLTRALESAKKMRAAQQDV